MAKQSKRSRIDLDNLTQQEKDILTLEVKDTMKRHKMEKQAVYDKRFALRKKIEAAGLTIEQVLGGKITPKKSTTTTTKRGRPKKQKEAEQPIPATVPANREVMVLPEKPVPTIMKPIEITFDNFTVKLNGVPKSISVNLDTHAIEIDF